MSVSIVSYTAEYDNQWDIFIDQSLNGNFLHKRSFYNSNSENSLDDLSFLFFRKNQLIAVLPGIIYRENNSLIYHSHRRSTYGGFVFNRKVGVSESIQIVHLLIEELKKLQVEEIIIRNPFRIFYSLISDEFEYALWYHDFTLKSRELEMYVDLTLPMEKIKSHYENGTKYNVKKAIKTIVPNKGELSELPKFWKILEENLAIKFNKKPVHTLEGIQTLISNSKGNILFFGAYHGEQLVGGCLIFKINTIALHAQYIAQDELFQEHRPINALIDFIIDWGKENGFQYFNLGTANEGGKVINHGLFHFKEGFGGRGVLRETHHLKINYH